MCFQCTKECRIPVFRTWFFLSTCLLHPPHLYSLIWEGKNPERKHRSWLGGYRGTSDFSFLLSYAWPHLCTFLYNILIPWIRCGTFTVVWARNLIAPIYSTCMSWDSEVTIDVATAILPQSQKQWGEGSYYETLFPVLAKKIVTPWNILRKWLYFLFILIQTDFGAHSVAVQRKIWTNIDLSENSSYLEVHSFPLSFSPWGQETKREACKHCHLW